MTRPPAVAAPWAGPMPLAPGDAVSRAFKAEERQWGDLFWSHVERCQECDDSGLCRTGDTYAANADAAGWRWQEAERREQRKRR